MGAQTRKERAGADVASPVGVNEVRVVGRISSDPEERELPSGDTVWVFRLVVVRPRPARSRQTVDVLDCAVWGGRLRRAVAGWAEDDVVEVFGALRRRFFRAGGATASRVEIEAERGRVIRRATTA